MGCVRIKCVCEGRVEWVSGGKCKLHPQNSMQTCLIARRWTEKSYHTNRKELTCVICHDLCVQ